MTRREIFFIVSLACSGIFILIGAYLLGESRAHLQEMAFNQESYAQQEDEKANGSNNLKTSQTNPVKVQPTNTANTTTNQTAPASPKAALTPTAAANPAASANPGNVQNPLSNTASSANVNNNYFFGPGCKVGDIVKLGDVEMIVTKSTARYKVIDITLKGNTSAQPPRLVLTDNNRIVYEIPADVDVNLDVTEKSVIDKSPLFNGDQKAGK